ENCAMDLGPPKNIRKWALLLSAPALTGLLIFLSTHSQGASPKSAQRTKALAEKKPSAPAELPSGIIAPEEWLQAPTIALQPGEIDRLVGQELQKSKVKPAKITTDEQFIRRVTLDLTGQLPMPADVTEFTADKDPRKRAKLIDQ